MPMTKIAKLMVFTEPVFYFNSVDYGAKLLEKVLNSYGYNPLCLLQ
jgi:hypothetical protein